MLHEQSITNVIHLAAMLGPLAAADPVRGALIEVLRDAPRGFPPEPGTAGRVGS